MLCLVLSRKEFNSPIRTIFWNRSFRITTIYHLKAHLFCFVLMSSSQLSVLVVKCQLSLDLHGNLCLISFFCGACSASGLSPSLSLLSATCDPTSLSDSSEDMNSTVNTGSFSSAVKLVKEFCD